MSNAFAKLPLTFRGNAAFSDGRDGKTNPYMSQNEIFLGKVVEVNQAKRTISCVGIHTNQGKAWTDIWVAAPSASQNEGSSWLPQIFQPRSAAESASASFDKFRDVIAVLAFLDGNPNIPVCLGFVYPTENEMSFDEPGLKLERHSSNVYERLTGLGNYEFVFPDKTFIKIAAETESDNYTKLDGKNYFSKTNPWLIKKDFNRKIVLSHSTGNKLRLSTDGVYIETYASTGADVGNRTGGYGFSQDGNLVLSGKELFISNTQTTIEGQVFAGAINASSLSLSGTDITAIINNVAEAKANSVVSQYFGGSGGGSGGGGSGGSFTLSPGSIADGSITAAKLSFDVATQAELDAHTTDSSIHFTIGTTATTAAAGNHTHSIFNNGTVTWGYATDMLKITSTTNNAGSGTIASAARIDHAHGIDIAALSAAPLSITPGATSGVGSSLVAFARADHVHGTPTSWPPSSHTHAYTDILSVSNAFSLSAPTLSLLNGFNSQTPNSLTLNPDGSITIAGSVINFVGNVKINGASVYGSATASSTSVASGTTSSQYRLYNQTTSSSAAILTFNGESSVSSTNYIRVAPNYSFGFRAEITGSTVGSQVVGAMWVVEGIVTREEMISSLELQEIRLINSYVHPSLTGSTISIDVDTTYYGGILFSANGLAGTVVNWNANVEMFGNTDGLPNKPAGVGTVSGSATTTFPEAGGSLPPVDDDSTYDVYILKGVTNSLSPVRLTSNGLIPTTSNIPLLSNNSTWVVDITVAVHAAGASAGIWKYSGLFRQSSTAASTTFLGPLTQEEMTDSAFDTATVTLSADTVWGGVNISVTGLSGVSCNWIAVIKSAELR